MIDYEKKRNFNYKEAFHFNHLKKILKLLHQPQQGLNFIHIAGTKGKTSTAFYIKELMLKYSSHKIGLYTSPHIKSPTERIQINFLPISEDQLSILSKEVEKVAFHNQIELTYFELLTVIAFLFFKRQHVDWVILETGLGGRLDSTNIVLSNLCIITKIDKDHTHILGKTKIKIAFEKLGILKKKVPFILAKQSFEVTLFSYIMSFIKKAPLVKKIKLKRKLEHNYIKIYNHKRTINFYGPLYAIDNFVVALTACEYLNISIPGQIDFKHQLLGRFEVVQNGSGVLLFDGAHNEISIKKLIKSIKNVYPKKMFTLIFNTLPDKNYKKMLKHLMSFFNEIIIVDQASYNTEKISNYLNKKGIKYKRKILSNIEFVVGQNYCIAGSFYLIGDIKGIMQPTN